MSAVASAEDSLVARYRGARERLGVSGAVRRAPVVSLPPPPPQVIYTMVPVYPEPEGPVDPLDESQRAINARWKTIVREVCTKHGISLNDIRSHVRRVPIVAARDEAIYRLRTETLLSFPEIGRRMGGFDHTTAITAYRRYMERNLLTPQR